MSREANRMVARVNPELYAKCPNCEDGWMKCSSSFLTFIDLTEEEPSCEIDLADELTGLEIECTACGYTTGITGVSIHLDKGKDILY